MSRQNNTNSPNTTQGIDALLESIINLYTTEQTRRPTTQTRSAAYPLSFNIQRPRPATTTQIPTPPPTTPRNTSEHYSTYLSIVHALRDISSQYNNNMRDYNTNIRQILHIIGGIREDLHARTPIHETQPTMPRPEYSRFYDGLHRNGTTTPLSQPQFTSRLPQHTPATNQSSNIFDLLFQSIPLTSNMENVVVRPTQQQIRSATRPIIYNPDNARIANSSCPITLEPFEEQQMLTQIMYCGHVFSQEGINRWFEGNVRCPICRYDIRNYNARCRQCRRPLQEYGTSCSYCEEARANSDESRDMETDDIAPESEDENTDQVEDVSSNPYEIIMNYEIRAPGFTFNRSDMSFNTYN
jgi:hypothetical protein